MLLIQVNFIIWKCIHYISYGNIQMLYNIRLDLYRRINMDDKSKDYFAEFFRETELAFRYLETDCEFKLLSKSIEEQNDIREKNLSVRYLSQKISIEISWVLSSTSLDIFLIENVEKNKFPSQKQFLGKPRNYARAISFYTYMSYLDKEEVLLLKSIRSVETADIAKRTKIINADLKGIIENLAESLRKYAQPIILGDTSDFSKVQALELEIQKKIYPHWKNW